MSKSRISGVEQMCVTGSTYIFDGSIFVYLALQVFEDTALDHGGVSIGDHLCDGENEVRSGEEDKNLRKL